jgi:hypothetical protein
MKILSRQGFQQFSVGRRWTAAVDGDIDEHGATFRTWTKYAILSLAKL